MKTRKLCLLTALLLALVLMLSATACNDNRGNPDNPEDGTPTEGEATIAEPVDTSPETIGLATEADTSEIPTEPSDEPTYTVKFMDGNTVLLSAEGHTGDFIMIPEDPVSKDGSKSFLGWAGMDEADYAAGKVEIFKEDLTFNAEWGQQFGTKNVYTATKLRDGASITVDGVMDAAYLDAQAIEINTTAAGSPGASAKTYIMWSDHHYYIFIEVTDPNVYAFRPGAWVEHNDGVEFRIDLLHNDSIVPDYNGGWGGAYRGEPGPMVEGGFKIGAGVTPANGQRFGEGAEAFWEWWSNHVKENGDSIGVSKLTDTGYTVEYQLELFNAFLDEAYRPHEGQIIGFGIRIYDKTADGNKGSDNKVVLETINDGMDNDARRLSNIKLIGTP